MGNHTYIVEIRTVETVTKTYRIPYAADNAAEAEEFGERRWLKGDIDSYVTESVGGGPSISTTGIRLDRLSVERHRS